LKITKGDNNERPRNTVIRKQNRRRSSGSAAGRSKDHGGPKPSDVGLPKVGDGFPINREISSGRLMAQFLDVLNVTEVSDSIFQVVDHPFRYQSDVAARTFTVPVGFKTDFASVPRILPVIYSLLGDTAHEPAVIHDYLYGVGLTPRIIADKVLLEAMGVMKMSWYRRWLIYAGVRAGGWVAWNAYRKGS
jgi:hypothetical protein